MSGSRVDLKVVLLGKEAGGKTSLVERYLHDRFHPNVPYQNTIGAAFGAKKVEVGGVNVTMGIWDTAGSERYEAMSRIYYRSARAAIVCFDLTDDTSFDRAKFWVDELLKNEPAIQPIHFPAGVHLPQFEDCKIYLTGTKCDLIEEEKRPRKVEETKVEEYSDEIHCLVFETSSKTGQNIKELFYKIAQDYVEDPKNREPEIDDGVIDSSQPNTKPDKCSC